MSRQRVLVVSAQFPYPPRFGFAMRVLQLARQLQAEHDVTLLSYAGPDELAHVDALRAELDVEVVARAAPSRARKRVAQALSIASTRPFACREVRDPAMQAAIDRLCAERAFDVIQLESSLLCAFRFPTDALLVVDEHNVEYEVFQRMQEGERSRARRAFHGLEHVRFRRFEQAWWRRADAVVLTSDREEVVVRREAPGTPTAVVPNGVDVERFRPQPDAVEPRTLVFNGLLQYRPNLDAALWLVDEIWPRIAARVPDARLAIVGRGDPEDLARLARPGVEVTGEVPDVRPHLHAAAVVAVPIRMGGGTRLKVVEGLAMGKAMVSTALGCEGIAVRGGEHLLIADAAEAFAGRVVELFNDPERAAELGRAGRALMEDEYSWEIAGTRLRALYDRLTPAAAPRPDAGAERRGVRLPRLRRRGGRQRVCIVRQTDLYEVPVKREAEALARAGYAVDVLLMRSDERPRRAVVDDGVVLISLPSRLGRSSKVRYAADYAWFWLLAASTLAVRHVRRPYDVVQVNTMPDFLVFAALVPKLLGARVIAYMKEPVPELTETLFGTRKLTPVLRRLEQWAIRFADHSLTVTEQMKQLYVERGAPADRITVVLNGADAQTLRARDEAPPREPGFTVICHGSIEERYGQDTILEAAALLHDELPDLRVVVIGRGGYADEMVRRIGELGLEGVVRFDGWVTLDRMQDLLRAADAGIVAQKASRYSHLVHTNKMVDYWIFGLPVIASRLRATAETYGDGVLEYFEPGDAASLAAAIRRVHDDPGRRAELIANGRVALGSSGWGAQQETYLAVYDALAGREDAVPAAR